MNLAPHSYTLEFSYQVELAAIPSAGGDILLVELVYARPSHPYSETHLARRIYHPRDSLLIEDSALFLYHELFTQMI